MPQEQLAKMSIVDDKQCFAVLTAQSTICRDTVCLEFKYQNLARKPVLPVGKHLKVVAPNPCKPGQLWNGEEDEDDGDDTFERKYTPSQVSEDGFVLVIKVYYPNAEFPDGGKMSQYLANIRVGDCVEFALPYGVIEYLGDGTFKRMKNEVQTKKIGMIAAGSGITPMLRLLEHGLANKDGVHYTLLFANREQEDIICKSRLDELAALHSDTFKLEYILSKPAAEWQGLRGRADRELLSKIMPQTTDTPLILCCGPPAMIKICCKENLMQLGYDTKMVWDF